MKKVYSVFELLSKIVAAISFVGLFIMVIFVVVDVVMRYLLNSPIPGDYDITQLWLSVVVFASLAYVQVEKGHIGVALVLKVLPQKLAVALFGVGTLIGAATCAMCSYSCYLLAGRAVARNMVSMTAQIPLYPFEYFEAFCMALMCIVMIFDAVFYFGAVGNEEARTKITDSWA